MNEDHNSVAHGNPSNAAVGFLPYQENSATFEVKCMLIVYVKS